MSNIPQYHIFNIILEAENSGFNHIKIEYKNGYEEITGMKNMAGFGLMSVKSNSKESDELFNSIKKVSKRKMHIINNSQYRISISTFDSFGETAYEIRWGKI